MLLLALLACEPPQEHSYAALSGQAFGTTWSVKLRGEHPWAQRVVEEELASIDQHMSSWRPDSELSAIREGEGFVSVSADTLVVVDEALELARSTDGAFDPTVEPLLELWGFRGERRTSPPSAEELGEVRARVGYSRVQTRSHPPAVNAEGTALDLSAIAKGYAVDRISLALSRAGAAHHMVEVGGEVRAHGDGPSGSWRLGVDTPEAGNAPGSSLAAVVHLRNAAMATSGNYRNGYELDGKLVVHTMDPRTGRPAVSEVLSATVVGPDCMSADGWATALMVLSPKAGLTLIEARPELDALLLIGGDDGVQALKTSGMEAWLLGE